MTILQLIKVLALFCVFANAEYERDENYPNPYIFFPRIFCYATSCDIPFYAIKFDPDEKMLDTIANKQQDYIKYLCKAFAATENFKQAKETLNEKINKDSIENLLPNWLFAKLQEEISKGMVKAEVDAIKNEIVRLLKEDIEKLFTDTENFSEKTIPINILLEVARNNCSPSLLRSWTTFYDDINYIKSDLFIENIKNRTRVRLLIAKTEDDTFILDPYFQNNKNYNLASFSVNGKVLFHELKIRDTITNQTYSRELILAISTKHSKRYRANIKPLEYSNSSLYELYFDCRTYNPKMLYTILRNKNEYIKYLCKECGAELRINNKIPEILKYVDEAIKNKNEIRDLLSTLVNEKLQKLNLSQDIVEQAKGEIKNKLISLIKKDVISLFTNTDSFSEGEIPIDKLIKIAQHSFLDTKKLANPDKCYYSKFCNYIDYIQSDIFIYNITNRTRTQLLVAKTKDDTFILDPYFENRVYNIHDDSHYVDIYHNSERHDLASFSLNGKVLFHSQRIKDSITNQPYLRQQILDISHLRKYYTTAQLFRLTCYASKISFHSIPLNQNKAMLDTIASNQKKYKKNLFEEYIKNQGFDCSALKSALKKINKDIIIGIKSIISKIADYPSTYIEEKTMKNYVNTLDAIINELNNQTSSELGLEIITETIKNDIETLFFNTEYFLEGKIPIDILIYIAQFICLAEKANNNIEDRDSNLFIYEELASYLAYIDSNSFIQNLHMTKATKLLVANTESDTFILDPFALSQIKNRLPIAPLGSFTAFTMNGEVLFNQPTVYNCVTNEVHTNLAEILAVLK